MDEQCVLHALVCWERLEKPLSLTTQEFRDPAQSQLHSSFRQQWPGRKLAKDVVIWRQIAPGKYWSVYGIESNRKMGGKATGDTVTMPKLLYCTLCFY